MDTSDNVELRLREAQLRRRGAVLCSRGRPLTAADLDAVEAFMTWLAGEQQPGQAAEGENDHGTGPGTDRPGGRAGAAG